MAKRAEGTLHALLAGSGVARMCTPSYPDSTRRRSETRQRSCAYREEAEKPRKRLRAGDEAAPLRLERQCAERGEGRGRARHARHALPHTLAPALAAAALAAALAEVSPAQSRAAKEPGRLCGRQRAARRQLAAPVRQRRREGVGAASRARPCAAGG